MFVWGGDGLGGRQIRCAPGEELSRTGSKFVVLLGKEVDGVGSRCLMLSWGGVEGGK